jgi:asparagine synthetase B (glutamine-hydrolysing)
MHSSLRKALASLNGLPVYLIPTFLKTLLLVSRKRNLIDIALSKLDTSNKSIPREYISSFAPNLNHVLFLYQIAYSLPHLLHYEDRNSMAFSLESRTPFTDYRLVDYLFSIPACYKYHNGWAKWLLRLAMKDLLPDEILWRKDKIGFAVSTKMEKYDRSRIFDIWNSMNKDLVP